MLSPLFPLSVVLTVTMLVPAGPGRTSLAASGTAHVPGWLITLAHRTAANNGDTHPSQTHYRLNRTVAVVTLHGRFVCRMCSRPSQAPAPRGSVISITVNLRTHGITDFGIGNTSPFARNRALIQSITRLHARISVRGVLICAYSEIVPVSVSIRKPKSK